MVENQLGFVSCYRKERVFGQHLISVKFLGETAEVLKVASRCSWPVKYLYEKGEENGRILIKDQTHGVKAKFYLA